MKICFVMYPWEEIDAPTNSTLPLIHEAVMRGHRVAMTTPRSLAIRNSVTLSLECQDISSKEPLTDSVESVQSFYHSAVFRSSIVPLKEFDVAFMRHNPPLDSLALNFLDSIQDDVFIVNSLTGLREANNKIYTAAYSDPKRELIPVTHVSRNINYLLRVIDESESEKMIMKPLDGFGGSGVIIIEKSASHNIRSLLDFYINRDKNQSNYVIVQEYIEGAQDGDIRVLMLNGKPLGAIRRRPAKGEVRSNITAGGSAEKYELTDADRALCDKVGKKLVLRGLYFTGLDLIGGRLVEVNVMSPGAIPEINYFNKINLQRKVIDYLEKVVKKRKKYKQEFRPEKLLE